MSSSQLRQHLCYSQLRATEQSRAERTPRDIYALAATLYHFAH